jgi:hypothetical protein
VTSPARLEATRRYRRANPARVRVWSHNRNRRPSARYQNARACAKRRGIEWSLDREAYYATIAAGVCFYCGGALPACGGGIDRTDNRIGYVTAVPCCYDCNTSKGGRFTGEEWMAAMQAVLALRKGASK